MIAAPRAPYLYIYPNHKRRTNSMLFSYFEMIFMKRIPFCTPTPGALLVVLWYGVPKKASFGYAEFYKNSVFSGGSFFIFYKESKQSILAAKNSEKARIFAEKTRIGLYTIPKSSVCFFEEFRLQLI